MHCEEPLCACHFLAHMGTLLATSYGPMIIDDADMQDNAEKVKGPAWHVHQLCKVLLCYANAGDASLAMFELVERPEDVTDVAADTEPENVVSV